MEQSKMETMLANGPIGRLIGRFAIPSVTAMLVNALYNIVDQIFIGRGVGYLGNGAANVVLLVTLVTLALSLLVGDGSAALFSLRLGEGRRDEAAKGAGNAILLITTGSLLAMLGCLIYLEPILRLFGCTDILLPYAMDYGRIVVFGLPFLMISTSLNALIRADGSPRYAMVSMIAGAVLNGCLDPVFIFGLGWGIQGAAWSSFIGQLLSLLLSLAYLRKFKCIRLSRSIFRPRPRIMGKLCALGISSFIDQLAFTLVMAVNNNLIVRYGALSAYGSEIPLTAYGISMKVQEILFTVLLGIAIGMQPIVGYNFGARNYRRVKQAYRMAVIIATVVSILAVILFVGFPDPVIHLFGSEGNPLYLEFSRKFFRTYFLFYVFFGFQTVTDVFFQAIGKPAQAAAISLSYQLVFKIVSAVLLSAVIGLDGVLWSGPIADVLIFVMGSIMMLYQLRRIKEMENALAIQA